MELILTRQIFTDESTEGELSINGQFSCYTLELRVKDGLPGSAIPLGKYLVILAPSPKFQRSEDKWVKRYADSIPHLTGIPGRSNILVHWGNSPHDTEGCVLVGLSRGENFIGSSRSAFAQIHPLLHAAQVAGEATTIEVRGERPQQSNAEDVQQATAGE